MDKRKLFQKISENKKIRKKRNKEIKQERNSKGITLIALVISIIVMLILAGVSLNAVIGDNGILTKAQQAKLVQEESKRREDLEYILYEYNSSSFLGQADGFTDYLESLKTEGKIEDYLYTDTLIVKYDGAYYETEKNGDYYEIKNKLEDDLTGGEGGSIEGNNYIVTPDNLTSGEVAITEGSSYVVLDEVKGEDFNFEIPAGEPVTIKIMGDMNIDNKGYKRSAIDLEEGATLNLYVYGRVEVNSGYGEDASGNVAGKGGYAGIHVPEGATLNLYGTGTLTAIGGNAGNGGTNVTENYGSAAGGGGAGAGIGGNGGNGGLGVASGNGKPGGNAENCGNINIYNSLTVYAYGGAGGSGGAGSSKTETAGGAGGYPGAGIGGGGAGGAGSTCCAGAGGYTGGTGDYGDEASSNGLAGFNGGKATLLEAGGGYFLGGEGISNGNNLNRATLVYGGFANQGAHGSLTGIPPEYSHMSGSGGQAGNGGNVKVSSSARIYAFNGNLFTDGTDYQNGINQCPIYSQLGVKVEKYKYIDKSKTDLFTIELEEAQKSINKSGYVNEIYNEKEEYKTNKLLNINTKLKITGNSLLTNVDMSLQGVGSGAGYIETSNGTYTVDSSMN